MAKKIKLLDTNVLIRFLTQDDLEKSDLAEKIFRNSGQEELEIPDFIITEVVWVLLSFYKLTKKEVIEKLEAICIFEKFKLNKKVFRRAIDIFRENNFSFVDAYLCALFSTGNYQNLYSFDDRLKRIQKKL